jgi:hypothetical protein
MFLTPAEKLYIVFNYGFYKWKTSILSSLWTRDLQVYLSSFKTLFRNDWFLFDRELLEFKSLDKFSVYVVMRN